MRSPLGPSLAVVPVALVVLCACASAEGIDGPDVAPPGSAFAVEVVSFTPGANAGFGQERLPDVVLGPPSGGSSSAGSTDVLSLGTGGAIVLRLGAPLVDGDGPDLLVFENAFLVGGGPHVNAEAGEVAVSADGDAFVAFACTPVEEPTIDVDTGCAGHAPVLAGDAVDVDATNPDTAGGDAFDLADVGLVEASFVRIVDRTTGAGLSGAAPSAGFDLDAIASVHTGE